MLYYSLLKCYYIFLSVLFIIIFDVKLNYFNLVIYLCGFIRLYCGVIVFFEVNIKLE